MSTAPPDRLRAKTEFYASHKSEWIKNHRDHFVVVKGGDLLGFFPEFHVAYRAGVEKYGMHTDFLVKRVVPQEPVFLVF